jgi:hypothetical protein
MSILLGNKMAVTIGKCALCLRLSASELHIAVCVSQYKLCMALCWGCVTENWPNILNFYKWQQLYVVICWILLDMGSEQTGA